MAIRRSTLLAGAALLAVTTLAPAAFADPSPQDMAAARSLGTAGVKLAASGDCAGAIPKLQAAEKLFHAPTTADQLGECLISTGKLVAGTEMLNAVVREQLAPNAPPAFAAAQQRAQTALQVALPKIAQLKIHLVGGPSPDKVKVTVDGDPVSSVLFDSDRPTDPGAHQVKAAAQGYFDATQSVQLAEGASAGVTLALMPDPNAAAAPAAPEPTPATPAAGPTPAGEPGPAPATAATGASGGSKTVPIILLTAGGVGVVVGSIFGVMALGTKSSLDKACTNKVCPSSSQSDVSSLGTQATVSTIGFGVGIVGVALGAYFLATSGGGDTPSPAPTATGVVVKPWIGLGTAGLGGTFQ